MRDKKNKAERKRNVAENFNAFALMTTVNAIPMIDSLGSLNDKCPSGSDAKRVTDYDSRNQLEMKHPKHNLSAEQCVNEIPTLNHFI